MSLREMAEIMANWLEGGEAPVIPPEWQLPSIEHNSQSSGQQLREKARGLDAITPEMLAAGIEAADLLSFEWGLTHEGNLISRVFLAMDAARRSDSSFWPSAYRKKS